MTTDLKPRTYSVTEAAQVLGVSRQVVYDLCRTDGFPSLRLGRKVRIPINAFHVWIEKAGKSDE
jgi:excisionase family DNA binding protein